jgi:phosphomevalonate kinase
VIEASAPGKLFVAGEYAVVEPGGSAILVAVDRLVRVTVSEAGGRDAASSVSSNHYAVAAPRWRRGGAGVVVDGAPQLDAVTAAIDTVEALAVAHGRPERPVVIRIESELDDTDGTKFGLGSSAAVVVATVRALAEAHDLRLDDAAVLRTALLATWRVAPAASGGDIAASTYGGWLEYRSTDPASVLRRFARDGVAATLDAEWPGLAVAPLPAPRTLRLLAGWTGSPASTSSLVRTSRLARSADDAGYRRVFAESESVVTALAAALRLDDEAAVSYGIRAARATLARYARLAGIVIETPALSDLCEIAERHGAAAKSSGAGGGDCGIALAPPEVDRAALHAEWARRSIRPLLLTATPSRSTP